MAQIEMVHCGLMDKLIHNSFELWNQSQVLVKNLHEEVCKHSNLTKPVLVNSNSTKTKTHLVRYGNIIEPKTQMALSSTASEDDSAGSRGHIRSPLEKTKFLRAHQWEVKKKNNFFQIPSHSRKRTQSTRPLSSPFLTQTHFNSKTKDAQSVSRKEPWKWFKLWTLVFGNSWLSYLQSGARDYQARRYGSKKHS